MPGHDFFVYCCNAVLVCLMFAVALTFLFLLSYAIVYAYHRIKHYVQTWRRNLNEPRWYR